MRRALLADQIEGQRLIGQHVLFRHPGSAGAIELRDGIARTARAQIDRPQPQRDPRIVGINVRRAPEKADRRFEIIHPHRRVASLDQRVDILGGLGKRDQRAVEALHFLARQGLYDLARDHLLRGKRQARQDCGQGEERCGEQAGCHAG